MKKLKYIVTGTGRCGTVYMARLLTDLNIPCGHESIFVHDGIDRAVERLLGNRPIVLSNVSKRTGFEINLSSIVAESSYMAAPFLNHESIADATVIHVVRHPVRVVNSFCNYIHYFHSPTPKDGYEANIYSHFPELQEQMSAYDRACLYYVLWNEMIEKNLLNRGFFFHRIEDDKSELIDFLDAEMNDQVFDDKKANTFARASIPKFTLNHIDNRHIKQMFIETGQRYGYNMSSEYLFI